MLQATGLHKHYRTTHAVRGVDVEVAPGQIVGLVGNNGAGKTTTIKMLCGLVEPSAGTVRLDAEDPIQPRVRQRLGFLPEDSPLYEDMTPMAYLAYFGRLYGMGRADIRAASTRWLTRLRLDEQHWRKPIGQLSKGSARKVAVARTLLHDPQVLVLDEPRSGLDPASQAVLDEVLLELRAAGIGILLSAHDLDQIERLCDAVLVMDEGRIVLAGSMDSLRAEAGTTTYRVQADRSFAGATAEGTHHVATLPDWPAAQVAMAAIERAGGTVLGVHAEAPRLADILARA